MICNKIADKIIKVPRSLPRNSTATVESETKNTGFDREIRKERYIYLQKEDNKLLISWDYYNNIII